MTAAELDAYCGSLASAGGVYVIAAAWIREFETEAMNQRGARRRAERSAR